MGESLHKISILIVTHNSVAALKDLSLLLEACASYQCEAVIVDNDSTDDTCAILAEYAAKGLSIRLIENSRNLGFGAGMNQAAAAAQGDLLLLANLDIFLSPSVFEAMAAGLESHPEWGGVTGLIADSAGSPSASVRDKPSVCQLCLEDTLLARLAPRWTIRGLRALPQRPEAVATASACCLLLRRSALENVGGFDEQFFLYYEDADLCLRLAEAGTPVGCLPDVWITHEGQAGSDVPNGFRRRAWHRSLYQFSRKHLGRWASGCMALLRSFDLLARMTLLAPLAVMRPSKRGVLQDHAACLMIALRALKDCALPEAGGDKGMEGTS